MLAESVSSSPTFWTLLNSWSTPTVFFVVLQLVIATIYITSNTANVTKKHHHHEQDSPQVADFPHHHQQLARSPSSVLQRLKSINFYSHYPYRSQESPSNAQEFQNQTHERENPQIVRSPSLLQRFKSINLCSYFPMEPISSELTTNSSVFNESVTHDGSHEARESQQGYHLDDAAVAETDEETEENDVVGDFQHKDPEASLDEIYSILQGQSGQFTRSQSDTNPSSGEVPVKLPRKMKKSASTKSAFSHFKEDDIVENRRPATVRESKVRAAVVDGDDDGGVDAKADDFINKFKQQLKLQRLDSIMGYKEMIGRGSGQ